MADMRSIICLFGLSAAVVAAMPDPAASRANKSHNRYRTASESRYAVRKHEDRVYYGVGGGKHQTLTGGPAGGITSRN